MPSLGLQSPPQPSLPPPPPSDNWRSALGRNGGVQEGRNGGLHESRNGGTQAGSQRDLSVPDGGSQRWVGEPWGDGAVREAAPSREAVR